LQQQGHQAGVQLRSRVDAHFADLVGVVSAGVALADELAPDLAADLLSHVALLAIVGSAGGLGSASLKEFPGLVVLPEPATPSEVAEALFHEGAHEKFFDLDLTCGLFGPVGVAAPSFVPSWRGGSAPWPLAQCFAAFHAYRCLAAVAPQMTGLHPGSLMPVADRRADELAYWLEQNAARHLSSSGVVLAQALGADVRESPRASEAVPALAPAVVRDCGPRRLEVHRGRPPTMYWVRKA
jgi:HEXXH motif-containing protein